MIFLVAFAIRMVLLVLSHRYLEVPTTNRYGFPDEMGRIAQSIALGHGFSSPYRIATGATALMPPVYPYLIAGILRLWGINTSAAAFAALTLNSLFSALTCVVLLWIGRIAFSNTVGCLSAWAWVFLPGAVLIPITQIWYDALSALLMAVLLWASLRAEKSAVAERPRVWVALGLLWGFAALANPSLLATMPFLLAWIFYRRRKMRLAWARPATITLAVFAVVLVPWLIRNFVVFHQPVFIRDGFGLQLYLGNHPGSSGAFTGGLDPPDNPGELAEYQRMGELAYMRVKQREAIRFIEGHPASFTSLCLQRFGEFWVWTGSYRPFGSVLKPFAWNTLYFLLPALAVLGLALAFQEGREQAWPIALVLISFPLVYLATTVDPRYRYPIEPEMALVGIYGLVVIWERSKAFWKT